MFSEEDNPIFIIGMRGRMSGLAHDHLKKIWMDVTRFPGHPLDAGGIMEFVQESIHRGQVPILVDFTHPDCTVRLAELCGKTGAKLVSGTSGLQPEALEKMRVASRTAAVFWSCNFSPGVYWALHFVSLLRQGLGGSWSIAIQDTHHKNKKDAPSSTALALADAWGSDSKPDIACLRFGEGVSEHTVYLKSPFEELEVRHRLNDRRAFLPCLVAAIRAVQIRKSGMLGMQDLFKQAAGENHG